MSYAILDAATADDVLSIFRRDPSREYTATSMAEALDVDDGLDPLKDAGRPVGPVIAALRVLTDGKRITRSAPRDGQHATYRLIV